jgi:hypothetical protein
MMDNLGLEVRIDLIQGNDAYAGMIEGTPWLARKFRLMQCRKKIAQLGQYVDGIDLLERELEDLSRDTETWAPNEHWFARLVSETVWTTPIDKGSHTEWPGHRQVLGISWYQEGGDPLVRLAEIVRGLDFKKYSTNEDITLD